MPYLCIVSMEHDLSASGTWRCRQTLCDDLCLGESELVEYRVEKFIKFLRFATHDGSLLVDHSLMQQVHGNLYHSRTSTLAVAGLKEPQFAFLHSELHVLHVVIVVLKFVLQSVKLLVEFRHSLFHRRIFCHALFLGDASTLSPALRTNLCDLLWSADTCHDVLALCIDEILSVEEVFAVAGIA